MAGINERTLQRRLPHLIKRGLLQVVRASKGGYGRTTYYQIPALIDNPDRGSGLKPRQTSAETPTPGEANPDTRAQQPRPAVTQSSKEYLCEQSTISDVVARLSPALRGHPNATPDRLAWIEREAPRKANPLAWAAQNIRQGWDMPPPTPDEVAAQRRATRTLHLRAFDAAVPAIRDQILRRARTMFPNLADPAVHREDSQAIRGAIARVLIEDPNLLCDTKQLH